MGFRRRIEPMKRLEGESLISALAGIGMEFSAPPLRHPAIEDTLFFASEEGMERDDLRVLSVLTIWLEIHADWINVNRLVRLVELSDSHRVHAYWSAIAQWLGKDRRYQRLKTRRAQRRVDLLRTGNDFQIKRKGEDPRFRGSCLGVPNGTLRIRYADVLDPVALAQLHKGYRSRIIQGPSYRADMWAQLEENASLTASELARLTYGSFETARLTKRDFELVHSSTTTET